MIKMIVIFIALLITFIILGCLRRAILQKTLKAIQTIHRKGTKKQILLGRGDSRL